MTPPTDTVRTQAIIAEVLAERARQDAKFGPMPRFLDVTVWSLVLGEEVGEVQKAILEGDITGYRAELIQVAAVAIAAVLDWDLFNDQWDVDFLRSVPAKWARAMGSE